MMMTWRESRWLMLIVDGEMLKMSPGRVRHNERVTHVHRRRVREERILILIAEEIRGVGVMSGAEGKGRVQAGSRRRRHGIVGRRLFAAVRAREGTTGLGGYDSLR